MKKISLLALIILISTSQQVFAEGRGPCHDDIKKFCGNVPEGAGIRECIKQHESSLSESCKGMMKEMESRHSGQHGHGPCEEDVKKLCGNVNPEGEGIRECIKQHESSLSESCKGMMKEMESRHGVQHGHGPCEEDVKKLCGNVNPEGGGIRECMKQHESEFSPACKDMMHRRMGGNEHRPER